MEAVLEPIYPISALQKKQGEIKAAAQENIVRITENGIGAYVFCSEDLFRQRLAEAAEAAAYETRMAAVIERGRADISAGRSYIGVEAAIAEIERRVNG